MTSLNGRPGRTQGQALANKIEAGLAGRQGETITRSEIVHISELGELIRPGDGTVSAAINLLEYGLVLDPVVPEGKVKPTAWVVGCVELPLVDHLRALADRLELLGPVGPVEISLLDEEGSDHGA